MISPKSWVSVVSALVSAIWLKKDLMSLVDEVLAAVGILKDWITP